MFPPLSFRFNSNPDYTEEERKKKLFGNINFDPTIPDEGIMNTEPVHPQQSMMDVYKEVMNRQEGPAMQAYRKYLSTGYPEEKNYQPSKLRSLGAILSGAATGYAEGPTSGIRAATNMIEEPFHKALERYKNEGARLAQGASLEDVSENRKMGQFKDLITIQRANELADSTIARNAAQAKAAGHSVQKADDGHVYSINIVTGEKLDLGKLNDSSNEKFQTEMNKFSLQEGTRQKNRVSNIGINFGNQKTLEGMRETAATGRQDKGIQATKELEDLRNQNKIELAKTRSDEIKERIKLRTDEQIRKDLALRGAKSTDDNVKKVKNNLVSAQAIYDTNPEKYKDVWDASTLTLKNPPSVTDPHYEDYRTLYNILYMGTGHELGVPKDPRIIGVR